MHLPKEVDAPTSSIPVKFPIYIKQKLILFSSSISNYDLSLLTMWLLVCSKVYLYQPLLVSMLNQDSLVDLYIMSIYQGTLTHQILNK